MDYKYNPTIATTFFPSVNFEHCLGFEYGVCAVLALGGVVYCIMYATNKVENTARLLTLNLEKVKKFKCEYLIDILSKILICAIFFALHHCITLF